MSESPARRPPVRTSVEIGPEALTGFDAILDARTLEEYVGQQHLLAPGKPLRESIERGTVTSMIFWGPPGTGKTTLGFLIARYTDRINTTQGVTSRANGGAGYVDQSTTTHNIIFGLGVTF